MEMNVNYTIVGAFVITLLTAIVLGIIWLSSGFSVETYSNYMVYMQESVTGLSIDAPVEYNGVNVGTVTTISLNHENPQLVELLLNIKTGTPITEGTVATLQSKGITGIAYIALKDKSTDLTPLRALPGQKYAVINTAPSFFLRLDTALSKLSKSISRASDSINKLLDPENLQSIKQTLKNLDEVTQVIAGNKTKIVTILNDTAHASQQFSPMLQTFNTQTIPATNSVLSNLNSLSTDIKENPSILIRGTVTPLGPGEQ
jgi:phospholipid/cholesterol/gamma-HCH transport system substrate-binding protein